MGRCRDYKYDAVIGIGGISANPRSEGIAEKINWVGIGPIRHRTPSKRACEVTFEHFVLLDDKGPLLKSIAPNLAKRFYRRNGARYLLDGYSDIEYQEAQKIVKWAKLQNPSESKSSNPNKDNSCSSSCKSSTKKRKCK
ncbi:hypothetical protein [Prosthecochloris sp.]|uniref:hypothetical protein n=1 Tax=Prosthecochloris sp. TaxID=290513 RepID=UPI00257B3147|nr:hypothetical protein [Prosthecochloris sp.]